jgi:hypothetical protein
MNFYSSLLAFLKLVFLILAIERCVGLIATKNISKNIYIGSKTCCKEKNKEQKTTRSQMKKSIIEPRSPRIVTQSIT